MLWSIASRREDRGRPPTLTLSHSQVCYLYKILIKSLCRFHTLFEVGILLTVSLFWPGSLPWLSVFTLHGYPFAIDFAAVERDGRVWCWSLEEMEKRLRR